MQRPLAAAVPGVSRDRARRARGGGTAGRGGAILFLCGAVAPGRARAEGAPRAAPAATAGRGMDTHYYGGEQSGRGEGCRTLGGGRRARQGPRVRGDTGGALARGQPDVNCFNSPVSGQCVSRCPRGVGGFVRSRGCLGWFVRTAPLPCPVRAGAPVVPVRFL